jgi:hypothetical protein
VAVYVGLEAIARRMGWRSTRTVTNRIISQGFLAYREKRNPAQGTGCGLSVWVTTDQLINAWLVARCGMDRENLKRRRAERLERRGSGPGLGA